MASKFARLTPLWLAMAAGLPAVAARLGLFGFGVRWDTLIFALGIVAGAFVVSWAVELLRMDVSGGLAIAALALVTVAPEYSVETVYAWKAGHDVARFAPLALANMTGSNRLLIGLGWPVVGLFAWWRQRKAKREGDDRAQKLGHEVQLPKARTIELAFLGVTSLYTLTLPLRTHLSLADAVILGGLYVLYVARVRRAGGDDPELVGPSAVIAEAKPWLRRSASVLMFLYSGAVLVASAEPFAKGVIAVGQGLGLSRFLAVRWLAPLASESPELLIAVLLAWRLQAPTALAALISSKLNQWTLLVGSIPVIFCISAGGMKGLPIDPVQREALFITAAQSIFALSLLADRRLTFKDAVTLLLLFTVDLVTSVVFPPELRTWSRLGLGAVYLALAIPVLIGRRRTVKETVRTGLWTKTADLTG